MHASFKSFSQLVKAINLLRVHSGGPPKSALAVPVRTDPAMFFFKP